MIAVTGEMGRCAELSLNGVMAQRRSPLLSPRAEPGGAAAGYRARRPGPDGRLPTSSRPLCGPLFPARASLRPGRSPDGRDDPADGGPAGLASRRAGAPPRHVAPSRQR